MHELTGEDSLSVAADEENLFCTERFLVFHVKPFVMLKMESPARHLQHRYFENATLEVRKERNEMDEKLSTLPSLETANFRRYFIVFENAIFFG